MRNTLKKIGNDVFPLLILPCIIIVSISIYQQFTLKNLIILSKKSTLNGLTQLNGANLLSLDTKISKRRLQELNPSLKEINITKKYPNTLLIEVINRIPLAILQVGNFLKYIDQDGFIFTDSERFIDMPIIYIPQLSVNSSQKADWRVSKALSFIKETVGQGMNIEQISGNNSDSSFSIKLTNGTEIVLPYNADISTKASSLQLIILRFRIEGKNISKIDFLFDKPVVTLTNGEKISSSL